MEKKHKKIVYPSFEQYLAQQMKNKAFRKAYKEESHRLEIAYRTCNYESNKDLVKKNWPRN